MNASADRRTDTDSSDALPDLRQWLISFLQRYMYLLQAHDATIERLQASLAVAHAERAETGAAMEEAQRALDDLEAAASKAAALKATADQQEKGAHLHVVPEQPAYTPPPPSNASGAGSTSTGTSEPKEPIVLHGDRSRLLLEAMATRPDHEWSAGAVAALIDASTGGDSTKKTRTGLDYLCDKGVLEKVRSPRREKVGTPGESHVHYRIIRNWRIA